MKKLFLALCFLFPLLGCQPKEEKLRIGYIPFLSFSQLFIIDGEGWLQDQNIEFLRFNGSSILTALQSGDLDGAAIATVPLVVAKSNGADIQIIAGLSHNFSHLVARGKFSEIYDDNFAVALQKFGEAENRPLKLFVNFKGSVQDLVARHWLAQHPEIDISKIEINNANPDQIQQALASGNADVALIPEPLITVIQGKDESLRIIQKAEDLFPGFPGGAIAFRREIIEKHPDLMKKITQLTVRATEQIKTNPQRAATHIHKIMGRDILPLAVFENATKAAQNTFVSDPNVLIAPTKTLHDYMRRENQTRHDVDMKDLFNTKFYDEITKEAE